MKLKEAIEVLKDLKRLSTIPMTLREGIDTILLNKAIDTVVAELEKPLPTDDEIRNMANEIGEKEVWPIGRQTGFVKGAKWMRGLIQERREK